MAVGNREQAIRALINLWIKTPGLVCATCGVMYEEGNKCCDYPIIGNNSDLLKVFLKELKVIRQTRKNRFAANDKKNLRMGASLPSNLYYFLDRAMRRLYNERLFNDKYDTIWFAKNFPQFKVPEVL